MHTQVTSVQRYSVPSCALEEAMEVAAECKEGDYEGAIKELKRVEDDLELAKKRRKILDLAITKSKRDLYERAGRLKSALWAAEAVVKMEETEENKMKLAELLVRMGYSKEAKKYMREMESASVQQHAKLATASIDPEIIFEPSILEKIVSRLEARRPSNRRAQAKAWPIGNVFRLCQTAARQISSLYPLQVRSSHALILTHYFNSQKVHIAARLLNGYYVDFSVLRTSQIKHLHLEGIRSSVYLRIPTLKSLRLSNSTELAGVDAKGLEKFDVEPYEYSEWPKLINSENIESLTVRVPPYVGTKCVAWKLPKLKYFNVQTGLGLDGFLTFLLSNPCIQHIKIQGGGIHTLSDSGILPKLRSLQVFTDSELKPHLKKIIASQISKKCYFRVIKIKK